MSLRQAQSVINTEFVRCVICVIMVQLETAGGNNSAPFVHSESFRRYNVLFLPWQGVFRGHLFRILIKTGRILQRGRAGWWVCVGR